ncbi:MAG: HEAT repeat domain-containing protein [Verrucomicrobiota bacterium]
MNRSLVFFLATVALAFYGKSAEEGFSLAEGLEISPAVAPGLVQSPSAAAMDDRGHLYVFDTSTLPSEEGNPPNYPSDFSIRRLSDTDGDGVFDQATRFADYLDLPRGAVWIYDSLYVLSPPGLWKFTDLNGDGLAEQRELLLSGFDSVESASRLSGPFLHPNGRLYWAHGKGEFEILDPETEEVLENGEGIRIWSTDISGGEVDTFAKGGRDEVISMDFTREGEILATTLRTRQAPRLNALIHWTYGGSYSRAPFSEDLDRGDEVLPVLQDLGTGLGSALLRYRSGTLHPDWADQWLILHFNANQLSRTRIRREEASFVTTETESIFQIQKPNRIITDAIEDHNGDLLVFDAGGSGRFNRIEIPAESLEFPGKIYRISKAESPYEAPDYPEWDSMTSEAVSEFLDVEEFYLRDRAGLELAGRGDPAIPELSRILKSPESTALAKRNAVWVLAKLQFSETTDLILEALQDEDGSVRQAAAHAMSVTRTWQSIAANESAEMAIELERNRIISGTLASIVRSDEPEIAREAATALGRMAEFRAIGALLGRLGRIGGDRFLEHAIVHALIEIDDSESTAMGLEFSEPATLRGVLRALYEMPSGKLEVFQVLPYLDAEEERLRRTAAELATRHPEWDAALANRFFEWDDYTPARIETMGTIVGAFAQHPPILDFLTSLITDGNPRKNILGLELSLQAERLEIPETWHPEVSSHLSNPNEETLRDLCLRLLHRFPDEKFLSELRSLAQDPSLPRDTRFRAVLALPEKTQIEENLLDLLIQALKEPAPRETRTLALEVLASSEISEKERLRIAEVVSSFSGREAPFFHEIFQELQNEEEALLVAKSLLTLSSFEGFDLGRLETLFDEFPEAMQNGLETKINEGRKRTLPWPQE